MGTRYQPSKKRKAEENPKRDVGPEYSCQLMKILDITRELMAMHEEGVIVTEDI